MKKIVFFILTIFTSINLFAQWHWDEFEYPGTPLIIGVDSDVWDTNVLLRRDNNVTKRLTQGERVLGDRRSTDSRINNEIYYITTIRYGGNTYDTLTSNLIPVNGRLPEDWISASDTQKKWVLSYYLDVLRSQNRDTFLNYERAWINWGKEEIEKLAKLYEGYEDTKWYAGLSHIDFESLVFFDAVIIMGGFQRHNFFITEIIPFNNVFKITMTGDRGFAVRNDFWQTISLPFPRYSERKSFDMIFVQDGDYMDVYLDSFDNKFASFAKVDAIVLEELEKLLTTNTVDLSNIVWPRRADGGIYYGTVESNVPVQQAIDEPVVSNNENPINRNAVNVREQPSVISQQSAETSPLPLWVWIAIVCGAALVVIVMLVVVKRKR